MNVIEANIDFDVVEVDEDHIKATAFNMLFMDWRRRTLPAAYRRGIDRVHELAKVYREGVGVCQVVEVDAVPPDSETRSMFVEFLRLQHVKHFSVTHEGVGFKAASVRAIVSGVHALARPKCEHSVFPKLSEAARWHEENQRRIGHSEPAARIERVMQGIRKMHRERYP